MMGKRYLRCLIGLGTAFLIGLGVSAVDAKRTQRVIVLESMTLDAVQERTRWLVQQLEEAGLKAGDNLDLVVLNAQGDQATGEGLLRRALNQGSPELVISSATVASKAAHSVLKETSIPQLFLFVLDPVGAGLVPAVGEPSDRNITGHVHEVPAETKLDMLDRLLAGRPGHPKLRIALLHSTYPASLLDRNKLLKAARRHSGFEFVPVQFEYLPGQEDGPEMLQAGLEKLTALEGQIDAVWLCSGPNAVHRAYLTGIRDNSPVPVVYANSMQGVELGALFALISDAETNGRDAGLLASAILGGVDAGSVPVERPQRFQIGFNIATSQELGAVIPSDLLELADGNLFR